MANTERHLAGVEKPVRVGGGDAGPWHRLFGRGRVSFEPRMGCRDEEVETFTELSGTRVSLQP
jgi:hypothetical protein